MSATALTIKDNERCYTYLSITLISLFSIVVYFNWTKPIQRNVIIRFVFSFVWKRQKSSYTTLINASYDFFVTISFIKMA